VGGPIDCSIVISALNFANFLVANSWDKANITARFLAALFSLFLT
jgi:hypothetical protein